MDEDVLTVIRLLDFGNGVAEEELSAKGELPIERVETAVFRLMKLGYCECDAGGRYVFGGSAYALPAVLCGIRLAAGSTGQINSVTRNHPPREK